MSLTSKAGFLGEFGSDLLLCLIAGLAIIATIKSNVATRDFLLNLFASIRGKVATYRSGKNISAKASLADIVRILMYLVSLIPISYFGWYFFYCQPKVVDTLDFIILYLLAGLSVGISIALFCVVIAEVLAAPNQPKKLSSGKILLNGFVAIVGNTISFALLYALFGFGPDGKIDQGRHAFEAIYFSAVTFSTLGYGDSAPIGLSKLFAPLQAMLGNLHLALIITGAFIYASTSKGDSPGEQGKEKS